MVKILNSVSRTEKRGNRRLGIGRVREPSLRRSQADSLRSQSNFLEPMLLQSQGVDTYERLHPVVERLLARLDKREAQVLRMLYGIEDGFPKTWREIGNRLRLSQEQASEVAEKALEKLHFIVTCRMQAMRNN